VAVTLSTEYRIYTYGGRRRSRERRCGGNVIVARLLAPGHEKLTRGDLLVVQHEHTISIGPAQVHL